MIEKVRISSKDFNTLISLNNVIYRVYEYRGLSIGIYLIISSGIPTGNMIIYYCGNDLAIVEECIVSIIGG